MSRNVHSFEIGPGPAWVTLGKSHDFYLKLPHL